MKTAGVELKPLALRVTETDRYGDLYDVLMRGKRFKIGMTPVIAMGRTHTEYFECGCVRSQTKEPDTFQYFEFELKDRRLIWRRDPELKCILEGSCALEFWTMDENDYLSDTPRWIHWVFPYTTWEKVGYGRYRGKSHTAQNVMRPDDLPDGQDINSGGFWKTTTPPPHPQPRRSFR